MGLDALRAELREFASRRAWEPFHTPKNLAMALAGEVGELLEIFQWLTPEESERLDPTQRSALEHELADVLIYLVRLADVVGVDLLSAAAEKMRVNKDRYPADRSWGSAAKYDQLKDS